MMGRRVFLGTLGLLPVPLAAEAQPVGKVHRLGILGEKASDLAEARPWQGLREELVQRGWIGGKNISGRPRSAPRRRYTHLSPRHKAEAVERIASPNFPTGFTTVVSRVWWKREVAHSSGW